MQYNPQSGWQRFLAKLLIRFGYIKNVPVDIDRINEQITQHLPVAFDIAIPGGDGELTILETDLSLDNQSNSITAVILCNFNVKIKNTTIYNSHLQVTLDTELVYCATSKTISPSNVKIHSMKLISDKYSVIKDTRQLIAGLLPEPMKTVFITTMLTTNLVMDNLGMNNMIKYLSLYLTGSKQRILDFHHQEIETKVIDFTESEDCSYLLDQTHFEERLFAEFGQQIQIKQGQLLFIFHPETASE